MCFNLLNALITINYIASSTRQKNSIFLLSSDLAVFFKFERTVIRLEIHASVLVTSRSWTKKRRRPDSGVKFAKR